MLKKNNTNLNNTKQIGMFLNCTLSKLGLNYANLGTRYLREIVKLAYFNNLNDVKYKELCIIASNNLNISTKKIDSNIYNTINAININLARKNFKDIFGIDFDYFYISPKKLTILLLTLLYNTF